MSSKVVCWNVIPGILIIIVAEEKCQQSQCYDEALNLQVVAPANVVSNTDKLPNFQIGLS